MYFRSRLLNQPSLGAVNSMALFPPVHFSAASSLALLPLDIWHGAAHSPALCPPIPSDTVQ